MMIRLCWLLTLLLTVTQTALAKPQATASILFQVGQAYPQRDLTEFLEPGTAYRLKVFGGAKVDMKFVGAVGLGWDITYSEHDFKGDDSGSYRRLTWDWFYLPISIGFFHFTPGLAWVVTDVDSDALGVKETSIRPAGIFDVGASVAFTQNFGVTVNGRVSKTIIDKETTVTGREINIVGDYASWFVGAFLYF